MQARRARFMITVYPRSGVLDQELISYRCSSCFVLVRATSPKTSKVPFRRFKSDRDEICKIVLQV